MSAIRSMTSRYLRIRYQCLFVSLLLTALTAPVLAAMGAGPMIIDALIMLDYCAAALSTGSTRSMKMPLAFLVLAISAKVLHALFGVQELLPASQSLGVVLCLVCAFVAFRFLLGKEEVSAEHIFAALSLYLLIGLIFAILHLIVQELQPSSPAFHISPAFQTEKPSLSHLIYFSFVTLGTLGYGDIVPVSGPARSLAVVEAMIGQLYLVVVVARLVALYRGTRESGNSNHEGR